jgi:type VI secretion system protein ImpA
LLISLERSSFIKENNLKINKLEEFLSPISSENPCGENLRRNEVFLKLKEIRNRIITSTENQIQDTGIWSKKNENIFSWQNVIDLCEEILISHSKDLQVCAYYCEANFKVKGFDGLVSSLHFMVNLCQKYWKDIYPHLDQDNLELRLAPFHWLQLNLPPLINSAPLINEEVHDIHEPLSWFWYLQQEQLGNTEAAKAKKFLQTHLENFGQENIFNLKQNLTLSIKFLNDLESLIENLSLENETTLNDVIILCEDILNFITPLFKEDISSHEDEINLNDSFKNKKEEKLNLSLQNEKSAQTFSQIHSCQEAYELIAQANSYLLKQDSHSPCPYLIRRALTWRKKSLYNILMELFTTTSKPQEIFTLLGLSFSDHVDEENFDKMDFSTERKS